MNSNKLTIKDSSLSFLISFLLGQLGVVVATCLTMIFYKLLNPNSDLLMSFLNSAIGYLISATTLYVVMVGVFFFFNRKKENFVCENCGEKVEGNGYTNHCPNCLWSKHVDINPGDRAETCHGLLKPIAVEDNPKKGYGIYITNMLKEMEK